MAKYLVKELREGDVVELKVSAKVNRKGYIGNGLGARNGVKGLSTLDLEISEGAFQGKSCSAVVEETDRIEVLARNKRTWTELFRAFFKLEKKKVESNGAS